MWYGDGMGGWGYAVMLLNAVIFWTLLVGGIVLLVRLLRRPDTGRPPFGPDTGHHEPAERVLADRYARGEIDDEEYRHRLETLRGDLSR